MKRIEYCARMTLLAVAVSCTEKPVPLRELSIATFSTAIDYGPYYVAKEFKWFNSDPDLRGLTVRHDSAFGSLEEISNALSTRSVQLIFAAEPPIILTRARGHDVRIVDLSCTLRQEILVRTDLPSTSPRDLRGRRIAVLTGTSSHYGLLKTLRDAGLSVGNGGQPGDVEVVDLGPAEAKAAFVSRNIDAWAVWPPFVEEQELAGRGRVLPAGDAVIQSVAAVPAELAAAHPNVVRGIARVLQRAKEYMIANPADAQGIIARAADVDTAVVRAAWPKHNWSARLDSVVIADIQSKADFLADSRLTRLAKRVAVRTELIDTSFVAPRSSPRIP